MNQRQRKKLLKLNHMWIDCPLIVITVVPITENYKVLLRNLVERRRQGKRRKGSWKHDKISSINRGRR